MLPDAFNMDLPDESSYKDINSESPVPKVTEEQVSTYMSLFNQDLKENVIGMYLGKFLRSVRFSVNSSTYICGRVSAEYTKSLVYKVDIKLDGHGVIQECQCQCKAGTGPNAHCKHVGLVYYATTKVREGIMTKETCTQQLQSFHQVKKYNGSPVKMQDTKSQVGNGLGDLKDFDPRPENRRSMPQYSDTFRSVWLNSTASGCAIRQLYGPANLYGIVNDHDYCETHPEDMFLNSLKVRSITEADAADIERKTRGQKNKEWREERLRRLQASSFGRICKATDRTDHTKLAWSLTEHKNISTDAINHGKKYEGVAREAYCEALRTEVAESGIMVCMDAPFLGCSPDGLVGGDGVIEIKCPFTAKDDMVTPDTVPFLQWSDHTMTSVSLKETHEYFYQVMGALLCTNRKWCDFVIWTFKEMKVIRISRDEQFISNMKLQLQDFFQKYFRKVLLEKYFYQQSHTILTVDNRF